MSVLLLSLLILPNFVFAYSESIIPGGQTVGIEIKANGVLIVGTYNIGNVSPAKEAGLQTGDILLAIDNTNVTTIQDMVKAIQSNDKEIEITYQRNGKTNKTNLTLVETSDKVLKTGIYVKDSINGLGTLTFIDPNTSLFGALGHEIIEKSTGKRIEVKDGKIYESHITSIDKSTNGTPGEKNASFNAKNIYGNIKENTESGIFGTYTTKIDTSQALPVARFQDMKLGKAKIRTVLKDEKVEEFDINILRINSNGKTKNILFEIIDERLLEETGGIVQGMSGSPIIQNDKIIGAVTHVVVDDTQKGYGIFIRYMLEEAEN